MNKRTKWVISMGAVVLIVSLIFNWGSLRTVRRVKGGAQAEFMQGYGGIRQATQEYHTGDTKDAKESIQRGVDYLEGSSYVMDQMGVYRVMGIGMFMRHAMTYLLLNSSSSQTPDGKHYEHVISVFNTAFQPLATVNPKSISKKQLRQGVSKVYQAMTPQERKQYEGWGT